MRAPEEPKTSTPNERSEYDKKTRCVVVGEVQPGAEQIYARKHDLTENHKKDEPAVRTCGACCSRGGTEDAALKHRSDDEIYEQTKGENDRTNVQVHLSGA